MQPRYCGQAVVGHRRPNCWIHEENGRTCWSRMDWATGGRRQARTGVLRRLAGTGPCAIVHLLPTHLRHRSALRPFPATLTARGFGRANTTLTQVADEELDDPLRSQPPDEKGDQVVVPVLSLKAASLTGWAELVVGAAGSEQRCQVVQAGTLAKEPPAPGLRYCAGSAEDAVRTFTSLATPTARRLASQLAAVPLALDTIQAVQRLMLPLSGLPNIWRRS
ncbi:hypothetical protein ACRJ4W_34735 [Streptomyces sp. GLT-R25]